MPTASTWTGARAPNSSAWRSSPANGCFTATTRVARTRARTRCNWIPAAAKSKVQDYLLSENRFKMLTKSKPEDAKKFFAQAQTDADRRYAYYQYLAGSQARQWRRRPGVNRPRQWTNNRNQ